jgi:hypothetical protein
VKTFEQTLNTTNPLFSNSVHNSKSLLCISQYGKGDVQNSAREDPASPPRGVSVGTDKLKVPSDMYDDQRETMVCRCSRSGEAEVEKKVGSKRNLIEEAKSGGVTSDTNHGMSFGLGHHHHKVSRVNVCI